MNSKFQTSQALLSRAAKSLTGGVSSPFRAGCAVPLYFEDGSGCRLRDVDGNEYIDYTLAWGPNILGYRHPAIVSAVRAAAESVHSYGAQHHLEYEVAEKIQALVPCAERVAFTSSGSEAVQCILRLARAATGRTKILKFEGHYHGWMDGALVSYHPDADQVGPAEEPCAVAGSAGQVPNAAENFVVARWNDAQALRDAFDRHGHEIAAVIQEPVLCNSGCILPSEGYLALSRELCDRYGALLVFDEVITGFRLSIGGAQRYYGVMPDLASFGKAVGGGVPLSVIAGRAGLMEQMMAGRNVAFGGTFNGNPISLAGAQATLSELSRDDAAALRRANQAGERLMAGLRKLARENGIPMLVCGFGAAFAIHFRERDQLREYRDTFEDDRSRLARFLLYAVEEGVTSLPDGRFYVSTVHEDSDIDETLSRLGRALRRLKA